MALTSLNLLVCTVPVLLFQHLQKEKKQLTGVEVEQTRRIANVHIHVERVIGLIRQKYTFISDTQPIEFLTPREDGIPLLNKVVLVCCALINLCDSVVPFH